MIGAMSVASKRILTVGVVVVVLQLGDMQTIVVTHAVATQSVELPHESLRAQVLQHNALARRVVEPLCGSASYSNK